MAKMRRMYSTPLLACLLLLYCSARYAATVSSCPYDFQAAACLIPPSCYDNTSVSDPGNCCWSVSSAFIFAGIKYSNRTGNAFLPEANASACSTGFVSYLLHNRLVRRSLILSGDRCNLNTNSAAGIRPCRYPTLAGIRSAVNLTDPTRICTAAKDLTLDQNSCTRCQNAVIASTMALLSLTKSKEFVPCGMAATIGIWATFPDSQRFRSYVLCMVQVLDNVGNLGTSDLIPSPPSLPPVTTQRPEKRSGKKTAAKTAAGVASAGFLTLVALFILGLLVVRKRRRFPDDDDSTATIKPQLPIEGMYIFTKTELNAATNGFDRRRLLGEGGAGKVYLGTLPSGQSVAIKRISQRRKFNEFYREVEILAKLRHRNLTTLVGYCLQKREHVLVYEYMGGGNLSRALFHGELTWHQRVKIAVDVAEALTYLHGVRVVHRDVKPGNVLLAENGEAKLSDFGLSKFVPLDFSHVSTEVKGTFGYLDPNCFPTGHVSEASDVYSFGIVLLELVTGKRAVVPTASGGAESIVNAAREIADVEGAEAELAKVADQRLGPEVEPGSIGEVFWVARRCVLPYQQERPKMEEVLRVLKKVLAELEKVGPKKAEVGRGGPPDTVSDESSGTPSSRVSGATLHWWSL